MPASVSRARAAADRLLKFRPRSEKELRQRLGAKGFSEPIVDALVQELTRRGLLNDPKFAQVLATSRLLSRPTGLRAVREELQRKGVDADVAEAALRKAAVGYDELAAARDLAARRRAQMRGVPPAALQRRLFGLLQRRGFSSDIVYKVIREIAQHGDEPI